MARTKKQIVDQLESSGAMMEERYAARDLLEEYKAFERAALQMVFQESYSENMRVYDLREHLIQACSQYALDSNVTVRRLDETLRRLSRHTAALVNGARGESAIRRAVGWLRCNCEASFNVEIEMNEERDECDAVLVTGAGIFIVEAKWSTSDVIIDDIGFYRSQSHVPERPYNVAARLRSKEHVLWARLEQEAPGLVPRDAVRGILLMANDRINIDDRFGRISICRCGELPYFIEEADGCQVFDEALINEVSNAVGNISERFEYPPEIDFNQLRSDLAETVSAIECAREEVSESDQGIGDRTETAAVSPDAPSEPWYERIPAWGWGIASLAISALSCCVTGYGVYASRRASA